MTTPHLGPSDDRSTERSRTRSVSRKVGVALVGLPLLGLGIALLPLPGPGSLVILAALAVLSLEFAWAERWSRQIREGFKAVFEKLTRHR